MRSDSYLDPEKRSVVASFRNPDTGQLRTAATTDALQGKAGLQVIESYRGEQVLSAYTPVTLAGVLTWALVAEIDREEAFAATTRIAKLARQESSSLALTYLALLGGITVAVVLMGFGVAKLFIHSIHEFIERISEISEGDLSLDGFGLKTTPRLDSWPNPLILSPKSCSAPSKPS